MGLFGFNAEKKLARARKYAEEGKHYEARRAFEEVAERADSEELRTAARTGSRDVRAAMIAARIAEADGLEATGDLEVAMDRLRTALDLAGDDLPKESLEERLRALEAPRRPAQATSTPQPPDLLPDPVEDSARRAKRSETTDPSELFGVNPGEEFAILMNTLPDELASLFQQQGESFRLGYLALTRGAPQAALRKFDEMDWSELPPAPIALERARALLLARRPEEALALVDRIGDAGPAGRWLRVEALRDMGRIDDAVDAAAELVNAQEQNTPESDALLAWTLIEAGRPEEAYDHLEGWLEGRAPDEEVLVPAAQALSMLDRIPEAIRLLENLIHHRLEASLATGREPNFPVQAGRRLLAFYIAEGRSPGEFRALVMHLLDFDPERGEQYRGLLLQK
jgi:tetratricopeptide (TPR) repeat protein